VVVARPRPRSARLLVVVLVSCSLAIITLDYRQGSSGPLAGLGRTAQAGMAPLQSAVTSVTRPIGNFFSGLANLPSLAEENRRLQEEVATANTQIARFSEQQRQLGELYELLGLKQSLDPPSVPAVVIGNGVSNFDWTVTIDKGSNDGIAADMPVVAGSADAPRLVGRVVAVTPISSEIQLLVDRDHAVAGLLGTSRETGLVVGQGEDDLKMDLITPGTDIALEGGPVEVFTVSYDVNGEQGRYPPGILIGTVSRVYEGSNELQTSVSVRPAVDFSALEYVLVLQTQAAEGSDG
jgi:rod shape-determining protein MreC